ncbi:MAG: DEAD/DEAH box helicase [Verrucomicrobiota bacterium]
MSDTIETPIAPEAPVPTFSELGLSETVLQGVHDAGYNRPTGIQAQAIPVILSGRDVIGSSQTGSGKTAAFALPILSRLAAPGKIRCLILEPVRELAAQVEEQFKKYGGHTGLRSLLVHGGVGYGAQREGLQKGVDILIATPGRLLDHMQQGTIRLNDIEILVLDEVDRMLDMGFLPDVRRIVSKCPEKRQTLFFSATIPAEIASLAGWALSDPFKLEIGRPRTAASTISHYFYPVNRLQREDLLLALLKETEFKSVMVFTRTKADADKLAARVNREAASYKVAVMHSDIQQKDRSRALAGFRNGEFDVIIATDLAARGLDISGVSHVVNYSVPENPEDYVHRIGRTGRAEREGDAFTILSADELIHAEAIERFINQKVPRRRLESFPYLYTTLLDDSSAAQSHLRANLGRGRGASTRRRR